jgi:dipeptidase E
MKLLLSSAGLTSNKISQALLDFVGKPADQVIVAFIPTAAFFEEGDKGWLIDDLYRIKNQGYFVDIVEISALPNDRWLSRLESADVLFFGGGNTFYLMHWLKKSGLANILPGLLKDKVYVGISAGSMIASPTLRMSDAEQIYSEHFASNSDVPGLGLIDFYIIPHLNSQSFLNVRKDFLQEKIKGTSEKVYALDDRSAAKVEDGKVEIVSEGQWLEFN